MNRRELLRGTACGLAASFVTRPSRAARNAPFIGVQVAPNSVFDEGPDHMLDFMQKEGGINTVCVSTHTLQGGSERPAAAAQADHGVPRVSDGQKPLTQVWLPFERRFYQGTSLGMPPGDRNAEELAGSDVLDAVIVPAHARGMKVYARHLEAFHEAVYQRFPAFAKVRQIDAYGQPSPAPCWNHPEYRAFWRGYVRHVTNRYEVDGLLLGAERDASLEPMLHHGEAPRCFCTHCRAGARKRGVDAERAREGLARIHALVKANENPLDGLLTSILRVMLRHPEVLAWETFQNDSKWSLYAELRALAKRTNPRLEVGWHLPMYPLNHDLFTRASWDYAELAKTCDFLKPSVYYDVNAARLHGTVGELGSRGYLREFGKHEIYDFFLTALGLDRAKEPTYERSRTEPFSADYVLRETRRCVQGVAGAAKVYAGIAVDIPHQRIVHQPKWCYEAARAAFSGGADGLLLSREYHFMRKESLNEVRRALRDLLLV